MQIQISNNNLSKIWIKLFQTYDIELIGNHISVNSIDYFFNKANFIDSNLSDKEKPFLHYNKYGQCYITQNDKRQIFFNNQDIKEINFTAVNTFGNQNDNGKYYNTLWSFTR